VPGRPAAAVLVMDVLLSVSGRSARAACGRAADRAGGNAPPFACRAAARWTCSWPCGPFRPLEP